MRRILIRQGFLVTIFASLSFCLMAQDRIFFLEETSVEVPLITSSTGEGEAQIEVGENSGTFKITLAGTVKIRDDEYLCLFCLDRIRIAENLQVPTTIFMEKTFSDLSGMKMLKAGVFSTSYQLETVTINGQQVNTIKEPRVREQIKADIVLEVPVDTESSDLIISGPAGATLRKEGNSFRLLKGEAYLVKSNGEKE